MTHANKAIPITGLGCLCAAGGTVPEVTTTLFAGQRHVQHRSVGDHRYPVFQLAPQDAPPGYFEGRECERCGRLAVTAAREALAHAGLMEDELAAAP